MLCWGWGPLAHLLLWTALPGRLAHWRHFLEGDSETQVGSNWPLSHGRTSEVGFLTAPLWSSSPRSRWPGGPAFPSVQRPREAQNSRPDSLLACAPHSLPAGLPFQSMLFLHLSLGQAVFVCSSQPARTTVTHTGWAASIHGSWVQSAALQRAGVVPRAKCPELRRPKGKFKVSATHQVLGQPRLHEAPLTRQHPESSPPRAEVPSPPCRDSLLGRRGAPGWDAAQLMFSPSMPEILHPLPSAHINLAQQPSGSQSLGG